jgi:hypothetical protein
LGEIYNPLKMLTPSNIILEISCYLTKGYLVMRLAYFVISKTHINNKLTTCIGRWPTTDRVEVISHEEKEGRTWPG